MCFLQDTPTRTLDAILRLNSCFCHHSCAALRSVCRRTQGLLAAVNSTDIFLVGCWTHGSRRHYIKSYLWIQTLPPKLNWKNSDLSHSLHVLWHWRILSLWALFMQEKDSCNRYLGLLASHYRTLKLALWNCIILISSMWRNIWLTMAKGWASKKAGWLNVKQNNLKYYKLCSTTVEWMLERKNWWLWFFFFPSRIFEFTQNKTSLFI